MRRRVGAPMAVLIVTAVLAGIWWNWTELEEKPVIREIVAWLQQKTIR